MRYTSRPVAVLLVQYANLEHQIVYDEEEYRPLHERHVESRQPFAYELSLLCQILQGKEVSGADEEQRHVEFINERVEQSVPVGVCHHHEDYSQCLGYADACVASHFFCVSALSPYLYGYNAVDVPSLSSLSYSFHRYRSHSIVSVVTFVITPSRLAMVCLRISLGHPE